MYYSRKAITSLALVICLQRKTKDHQIFFLIFIIYDQMIVCLLTLVLLIFNTFEDVFFVKFGMLERRS